MPFYIGKGSLRSRQPNLRFDRAFTSDGRNPHWHRIVAKEGGFEVEIMLIDLPRDVAIRKEKEFIKLYGRSHMTPSGLLCNITEGGDGGFTVACSEEKRKWLSLRFSGEGHPNWGKRLSAETVRRKSEATKGTKHHLYGQRLPEVWRSRIAAGKLGKANPMYGRTGFAHPRAKHIIDTATGAVYPSVASAAVAAKVNPKTMYEYMDGKRPNRTTFKPL